MKMFKQKYIVVMESGEIVHWTGEGENFDHGLGLAHEYAIEKTSEQIYDSCRCPVK